jgi:hypothetical protein
VVIDGENVVECVVNVVFWQSPFRGKKCARFGGFIFGISRFRNERLFKGRNGAWALLSGWEFGGMPVLLHECPHLRVETWASILVDEF